MAGIKNKYDFYKGFLEALGAENITETDYKNEEELRKRILDALGVEYVFDDVNQTDLFREKFLQGISSGGGGSSDFSTANVTIVGGEDGLKLSGGIDGESEGYIFLNPTEYGDIGVTTIVVPAETTITTKAVLFKNLDESFPHDFIAMFGTADGYTIASVEGDCVLSPSGDVAIWGDCTITGGSTPE